LIATPSEPGTLLWTPSTGLVCDTCANTWAQPEQSTLYTVNLTAENGCSATDQVLIILNGSLFLPNTFTPNGDGVNEEFGAWGTEIAEIELLIFDRWGELIFESDDIERRWDGTYKGIPSPIDTYVWKVQATELSGFKRQAIGHVNLVR
jgi:gliding motility-associated-like protein